MLPTPLTSHVLFNKTSSMDSSNTILLTNLFVFNNTVQQELIRSVHVYCDDGEEEREVEREFVFSESGSYVEMQASPILTPLQFRVPQVSVGFQNGVWICIFAFRGDRSPRFSHIPSLLLLTRNPKLQTIPNLLNDLQMIYKLDGKEEDKDAPQDSAEQQENSDDSEQLHKVLHVFHQDLNCLPYDEDTSESQDNEINDESLSGSDSNISLSGSAGKKRRAPSEHIAKIGLSDLVKYFDMPIVEASRNLNVGLTALKKKCREFGIPRWPHRKIKSLDSLIHDLQEEAKKQEPKDKDAAMAVAKRQKMLESEKENIEKKPFIDIQNETKRFRQDVFKRRHRARAVENKGSSVSST